MSSQIRNRSTTSNQVRWPVPTSVALSLTPDSPPATASIAGAVAGLLGLTNLSGFAFYLASSLTVGAFYALVNCQARPARYFAKASDVYLGGLLDNAFAFVLFWTRESSSGTLGV